jgi:flagellin
MYQNRLRIHNDTLSRATERLATGSRINHAKDDPFRNSETSNINSKIRNTQKAILNSNDGAALLQIAEGTCNEVQSILQRIRELSVQSANDTLSSMERHYLSVESSELLKEIDRIVDSTTFNTKQIFGNKGYDSFSDEQRNLNDWKPFSIAKNAVGQDLRAGVLHIGPGATKPDEVKVSIPEISANSLGLGTLSITYQGGAAKAIDDLDSAINSVSIIRSYMGILVNRMEKQVEDLEGKNIEMNDYVNKVRDTDFAQESTDFASAQIQHQAAISVLAQSNSRVSRVLEILG